MDQAFTLSAAASVYFSGSFANRAVGSGGYTPWSAVIQVLDATATTQIALSGAINFTAAVGRG
jgi:hypothetical protein